MRVRIANRDETAAFVSFLRRRTDVVVGPANGRLALAVADGGHHADELEVDIVASLSEDAMRFELDLLLRAWAAACRAEGKDSSAELV
jgi:hypothetical protein